MMAADAAAPQALEAPTERPIRYSYDAGNARIILPEGAPFDGEPVLIRLGAGWCEAWWDKGRWSDTMEGREFDGFEWVCLDGQFTAELDDARGWLPLPAASPQAATEEEPA